MRGRTPESLANDQPRLARANQELIRVPRDGRIAYALGVIVGGILSMFGLGLDREARLREHVLGLLQLHAVKLRVVLAGDADVVDHAEHAARLQRVVHAL